MNLNYAHNPSTISFRQRFKSWRGLLSLMEGGWIKLPIRIEDFTWDMFNDDLERILEGQIREALQKYHIPIELIQAYSMFSNGDVLAQRSDGVFDR